MPRILIVERDPGLRADLARAVRAAGYRVESAPPGEGVARRLDAHRFDAVVIEVEDPADLEWVGRAAGAACRPAVIVIGGAASPGISVAAMRRGASDFLRKPFRIGSLERVLSRSLAAGFRAGERQAGEPEARDPAFAQLLRDARAAAASDVTIHLVGESGSGKKWLARAIHRASPRAAAPFVVVDLGGLPAESAVSELFGSSPGGSAVSAGPAEVHPGQVACADGGTLLLGEIGEASPELQSRLLRLLHERTLQRSGAAPPRAVDIRVIATTQRNLRSEVDRGRFREDLFYRLDVVVLRVPPLRERAIDIPVLARIFLERFANQAGCDLPRLDESEMRALAALPLRGNVRELQNLMQRAVVLFPGARVRVDRLLAGPARPRSAPPSAAPLNLRDLEREAILRSLREHGGNRTHASRALGINVRTLRNKIRAYGF